jgi:uncharacterized membrane protein YidH (DUF202 family)
MSDGSPDARLYDPAAQNERTALAWSRSIASLIVALLIVVRVSEADLGAWSYVLLAVGVPVAVVLMLASRRRYGRAHSALHAGTALPDMKLPATLAGMCVLLGAVEAVRLLLA